MHRTLRTISRICFSGNRLRQGSCALCCRGFIASSQYAVLRSWTRTMCACFCKPRVGGICYIPDVIALLAPYAFKESLDAIQPRFSHRPSQRVDKMAQQGDAEPAYFLMATATANLRASSTRQFGANSACNLNSPSVWMEQTQEYVRSNYICTDDGAHCTTTYVVKAKFCDNHRFNQHSSCSCLQLVESRLILTDTQDGAPPSFTSSLLLLHLLPAFPAGGLTSWVCVPFFSPTQTPPILLRGFQKRRCTRSFCSRQGVW